MKRLFLIIPVFWAAISLALGDENQIFFEQSVLPLLESKCFECHSHESGKAKGGLVLDSRNGWEKGGSHGPVVSPGKPEESLLMRAIEYGDEDLQMPPKQQLPAEEVAVLRKWIADGAFDPRVGVAGGDEAIRPEDLWSFQPVESAAPPKVSQPDWALNDVDRFVLAKLDKADLKPAGDAEKRVVIRRLYLDLIGLPPTLEQMDSALRIPHSELIDELLESPQFGERWARHWLDTARYAESNGNNRNRVFRYAWRYRNWVIDAHNGDLPYDEFLKQQLAGDLMASDSAEARKQQRIATGFLAIGPKPYFPTIVPFDPDEPDRARYDWAAEQIDATMAGMLGLTVGCARCHDHKTDPIPTRDYYALAGIFRSTEPRFGMWHHLFGVSEGQAQRDFLYDWNLLVLNDDLLDRIVPLQEEYLPLVMEENELRLHQHHWPEQIARQEEKLRKGGLSPEVAANIEKGNAERRQQLLVEEKRLPEVLRLKQELKDKFEFEVDQAMGAEDAENPADVHLRIAGEHADRGPLVPRGFVSTLKFEGAPESIDPEQSGRLELAEWVAHPNNPLTARVAVNRIWYRLFGRGLVNTLDNLGASGEAPTHPQLLDHLAHKFVHEFSWSRKKMIRYLVSSRVYRLTSDESQATPAHFERDPQNTLFWRTTPRRLEAEAIRDSMLAVSGRLNPERPVGSTLVDFEYHADIVHPERVRALEALNGDRRTIYVPTLRSHRNRLYDLFDYPDDEAVNSARDITTVPTQALFLMNNPLVMSEARILSERLEGAPSAKLEQLYRLCFGRSPTAEEIAADLAFLEEQQPAAAGWKQLAHSLLISGEFLFRL